MLAGCIHSLGIASKGPAREPSSLKTAWCDQSFISRETVEVKDLHVALQGARFSPGGGSGALASCPSPTMTIRSGLSCCSLPGCSCGTAQLKFEICVSEPSGLLWLDRMATGLYQLDFLVQALGHEGVKSIGVVNARVLLGQQAAKTFEEERTPEEHEQAKMWDSWPGALCSEPPTYTLAIRCIALTICFGARGVGGELGNDNGRSHFR